MAQADGVIVFTGATTSVPTLSEWGMAIMALILAGLAYRTLRQGKHGGTPLALLVGAAIFVAGLAGNGMIARASTVSHIDCPGPGSYTLPNDSLYTVTNTSNGPLFLQSITGHNIFYSPGKCEVNMTLQAGQTCSAQLISDR